MTLFGDVGSHAGSALGGVLGRAGGELLGGLLGFKKGGRVPGPKGRARLAIVHDGEYVLPIGVEPTKAQKKSVARKNRKNSKK